MDPRAAEAITSWFQAHPDLQWEQPKPNGWFAVLRGERKRTIPFYIELGDRTAVVESHFMRAPDENHDRLYAYLLRRNLRTYLLRFALYDSGDVMLVGVLPLPLITTEEIDRVAGQVLTTADEAFNEALRLGFASYIEREQAWRARVGLGRNPVS